MTLLDSPDHLLVRLAEPFLLWTTHMAFAVEAWRRHSGPVVRRWLTATGEMEARCSLASHAFEHPADPFPEFVQPLSNVRGLDGVSEPRTSESGFADRGALLEAEAIGHPLIEEGRVVRNDVRIGGAAPAGPRGVGGGGAGLSGG